MLSDKEITQQIQDVIDDLQSYFLMHGGAVELLRYEDGTVFISMQGNCQGCALAGHTIKSIEDSIIKEVPQVKNVIPV